MKFYFHDHQSKGSAYLQALLNAGYTREGDISFPVDFAFLDHDVGRGGSGNRPDLIVLKQRGAKIFFYPHTAMPMVIWDIYEPFRGALCNFTISDAHIEVMKIIKYPVPMEKAGWAMCPMRPFAPTWTGRKPNVLFAPIHPNANGFLHPVDKGINAAAFAFLLSLGDKINLKVRHIKNIDKNGLWKSEGVEYKLAGTRVDAGLDDIDNADIVVAHQTLAYLSAARGKPLIMFGDNIPNRSGNSVHTYQFVSKYEEYHPIIRYPLNMEDTYTKNNLFDVIQMAMTQDVGADWRCRVIGEPFDPQKFIGKVEEYYGRG